MPASPKTPSTVTDVACPFCGLVCDDLVVDVASDTITVRANGCRLATTGFGATTVGEPRIAGRPATLAAATAEAARLLSSARQPLIGGLSTDVDGARAAARLADRTGAVLDHMNAAAAFRNVLTMQDSGWITTTLSEIRNRADLLVVVGGDIVSRFPRFFERCIVNQDTLFSEGRQCEVIFLGAAAPAGVTLPGPPATISCEVARLGEAFGALRAQIAGRTLTATDAAGAPMSVWQQLATRMKAAKYGVIAWAVPDLDFPHAELTVQALCEMVKELNRTTRFAGLPLGGSEGDLTVESVFLWQTGFGSRTSFGQGQPDHDAHQFATAQLLGRGETDLLFWIASFNAARTPPTTTVPTVVLGRPGMIFEREPAVFIPVGTPGVDHAGHLFRTDRVVALPLGQLRASSLPSVASVLTAVEAALQER
ncbi:MAG: formylmethanofuran dehydrogenase subunit B [Gemmatimonadales bacterium]